MARTVSAEFKAIWQRKRGKGYNVRVGYKRRYWNGAAFVNETDWKYLYERDHNGVGSIPWAIDSQLQNVIRAPVITLNFKNTRNEWKQSAVPPSFFAADSVATDGYKLFKTLFMVQVGYELAAGTTEWVTQFTGYALAPKISRAGTAAIRVMSKAALELEKSDPSGVSTDFTLEDCIPATGDGSNKDFESTSVGVNNITDVQVNGVSLATSGYRVSNNNTVPEPGQTGRIALTLEDAPGAGQTVKCSGRKWLVDQELGALLALLAEEAGVTSAWRNIGSISIPSATGYKEVNSQVEWEAFDTAVNLSTDIVEGSALKKWHMVDNFEDGDYTGWSTFAGGNYSIDTGTFKISSVGGVSSQAWKQYTNYTLASIRTLVFSCKVQMGSAPPVDNVMYARVIWTNRGQYAVKFNPTGTCSFERLNGDGSWTALKTLGSLPTAGQHEFRITISSAGVFHLWQNGTDYGTVSEDPTPTIYNNYFWVHVVSDALSSTNIMWLDYAYWSEGEYEHGVNYESADTEADYIWDLASVPTAMGRIESNAVLNGGTVTYTTAGAVDSGGSPGAWDALVATDADGQMNHTPKQWLKVHVKIDDASTRYVGPTVQSFRANFYTTSVIIALANHGGDASCWASIEAYLKMIDYEGGTDADGKLFVRSKDVTMESVVTLTQENGIIDLIDYSDGNDDVQTVGRVTFGQYVREYDGADAGETSPTPEEEYGRILPPGGSVNLGGRVLANDVDIAHARAQLQYERKSPAKRKVRFTAWVVPWVDVSDKVNVTIADQTIMLRAVANDPCSRVGPYFGMGDPQNVLLNAVDMKVLEYKPNWDSGVAEIYAEEIL